MKQFFKMVFASMLGAFLSAFALLLIGILIIVGLVANASKDTTSEIKSNSILHIILNNDIVERSSKNPFQNFDLTNFDQEKQPGLTDIVALINAASTDNNIKAIYLDIDEISSGIASVEEIRNALIEFKKSKKPIISYSEVYTQKAYYLASVADKIYLNPAGLLEFKGFSAKVMFYKGALEKLEIEPEIIRVGSFKSAVEPYMLDHMSDSSKLQTNVLLNSIYQHFLTQVSKGRNISIKELAVIANELKVQTAQDALKYKLVDGLKYKDEIIAELSKISNTNNEEELKLVSLNEYLQSNPIKASTATDKIAVIYAAGEIVSGSGNDDNIGSERVSAAIRKARLDKNVKAIVLRINSPGGSALASDVIWREVILTKKVKPVIASMGDVAASGGYYIACAADQIIAEPNTITGSIGVFGVLFNAEKFFKNKLGITFDGTKTAEFADLGDYSRPLSPTEKNIIQQSVNQIYKDFTNKVAAGRNLPIQKVLNIAGGRVWSGSDALRIGLVDSLGNMNDALRLAAQKANLKDYRIINLPEETATLEKILTGLSGKIKMQFLKAEYGEGYQYYQEFANIKSMKGIQTRLPVNLNIQ
jgi:protease IV